MHTPEPVQRCPNPECKELCPSDCPHDGVDRSSARQCRGCDSGIRTKGIEPIDDRNRPTGIAPDHRCSGCPRGRSEDRQRDSTEVTPAVPLGVSKMNRIGTAVLFRMNWEQRSNPIPIAPAVVAVLSELSICRKPSMLQSMRLRVQTCGWATSGPSWATTGEVDAPTEGRFHRSTRLHSMLPAFAAKPVPVSQSIADGNRSAALGSSPSQP